MRRNTASAMFDSGDMLVVSEEGRGGVYVALLVEESARIGAQAWVEIVAVQQYPMPSVEAPCGYPLPAGKVCRLSVVGACDQEDVPEYNESLRMAFEEAFDECRWAASLGRRSDARVLRFLRRQGVELGIVVERDDQLCS